MTSTLVEHFIERCQKQPLSTALVYVHKNKLLPMNWAQVKDRVKQMASLLHRLGIKPGDRVALWSNTCKEWGFIDMATMSLGAVTVPIYHSSPDDDVQFILEHSQPKILFIENEALYNKFMKLERKPNLKAIAMQVFASAPDGPDSLPQLISSQAPARELEIAQDLSLDDLATLIYTSGTSGQPKGVELTHRQVISSVSEVFDRLDVTESDRTLTFLPLSHILARQELWGHYYKGYCMGYGRSVEYLKKDLPLVQPTVLVAVPRIFEKIYLGIHSQVEISKLKHWLFHKALKAGEDVQESYQRGQSASLWSTLKKQAAHQAVLKRVQERLGGRLRFAVSGGAPLDTNIAQFFKNCGLPILEGYGLTETTGAIFVNTLFEHKVGAVGKTIGEVQIKLDEDGEILIKSDKVMRAYHKDPKGTQNAFTDDGYFRTGDIGHQDEDGYLFITDRKKDLIKTANGKFVAPQKLQNRFSREPLISQVHIHGDKRKYIVALLTLDINSAQDLFSDDVPAPEGSSLSQSPRVVKAVRQAVARVNSELASHETIKNYHILDREFSIEEGEITPSLKMRRKAIDQKYADTIQALYKDPLI